MDEQQGVTLGEVHRLCLEIRRDVRSQNGRVRALENDAIRLKTVWVIGVVVIGLIVDYIKRKFGFA